MPHTKHFIISISADCGIPEDLVNAMEVFDSTFDGNVVTFVARRGYSFNGSITVNMTCNGLGKWAGVPEDPEGN